MSVQLVVVRPVDAHGEGDNNDVKLQLLQRVLPFNRKKLAKELK